MRKCFFAGKRAVKTSMALAAAVLAGAVQAANVVSPRNSAHAPEILCENPGTWTFETSTAMDMGRTVFTVRMNSPMPAPPPQFDVYFTESGADAHNLWVPIYEANEQRRIAADYILGHPEAGIDALRVPVAVKRAIAGADKAMARSRKRAEKGLCTREESDDFCTKSAAALKTYLDKQVKEGVITPAERKALGR